jgi:hypothetical protein
MYWPCERLKEQIGAVTSGLVTVIIVAAKSAPGVGDQRRRRPPSSLVLVGRTLEGVVLVLELVHVVVMSVA